MIRKLFLLLCLSSPAVAADGPRVVSGSQARPVVMINEAIEATWSDYEIKPAHEVDDALWCRRVYLDIIGRIPTLDELTEFARDRHPDKKASLVARLLHDDRYRDAYADHWAATWTNLLIGRAEPDRRSMTDRDGMKSYLRSAFAENRPYDLIVSDLITATGSSKPGTENFNGAVNFLIDKVNADDAVLATSSTSRIFLGLQVQCTQCHDHPFNRWKQDKFWQFNSFFRQARGLRRFVDGERDVDFGELVDEDFAGGANDPTDALIYYEQRNALTKVAYPVFPDGRAIDRSGYVDDVNRRVELAKLMLESDYLAKMMVNRTWATFLGYGFTKPIDDLGPHNPPTHPDLLNNLAAEFRRNGYDIKDLITWITLSRPYSLDATLGSKNEIDDPSVGETPKFSRFYLRQMSAEQLYASLLTTSGSATGGASERDAERRRWLRQFVVAFGTDEGDEATTFNGSIPQALMLFNGDLTKASLSLEPGGFIDAIVRQSKSTSDALNRLYLTGIARRPSKTEQRVAAQLYRARGGNGREMLQDMWWAIVNSNEFILQH